MRNRVLALKRASVRIDVRHDPVGIPSRSAIASCTGFGLQPSRVRRCTRAVENVLILNRHEQRSRAIWAESATRAIALNSAARVARGDLKALVMFGAAPVVPSWLHRAPQPARITTPRHLLRQCPSRPRFLLDRLDPNACEKLVDHWPKLHRRYHLPLSGTFVVGRELAPDSMLHEFTPFSTGRRQFDRGFHKLLWHPSRDSEWPARARRPLSLRERVGTPKAGFVHVMPAG